MIPIEMSSPIVCDMTSASDTGPERLAAYQRLFADALIGRARSAEGIVFRFRSDDGVVARVRDLAAREKACCPFFEFRIVAEQGEVHWYASVPDDETARAILDEFYGLPETAGDGVDALEGRLAERGFEVVSDPDEAITHVRPAITPAVR